MSEREPRRNPANAEKSPPGRGQGGPPPAGRAPSPAADALAWALTRVADRWTLHIVDALLARPLRFGELSGAIPGLAPNILTNRLRGLEREGIVHAVRYQERPARFEYQLTEVGRDLAGALALLQAWGARQGGVEGHGRNAAAPRHPACGTELEVRPYCPTCERVTAADEELIWV